MKLISIPVVGCMFLLSGCQQAEEFTSVNENLKISIEASVGKEGRISGRSVMDDDGKVSFQENDSIGMSVNGGSFAKWTLTGSTWLQNPEISYWENKEKDHNFCAFYPFDNKATLNNVPMPDLSMQKGKKEDLGKYDFLVATKEQAYEDDGTVYFSGSYAFEHELSLITITLKGEGDLISSTINKISLKGNDIVTRHTYSFEDSEVNIISDEESVNELTVSMTDFELTTAGHTFYFILNSETVTLENVALEIEYKKGDNVYVATLEGMGIANETGKQFEKGKQYNYSLRVIGNVINISGNEIKGWDEGIIIDDIVIDKQ